MISGRPIRVGVLLDSLNVCNWQAQVLRSIMQSDHASLVVLALNHFTTAAPATSPGIKGRVVNYLKFLCHIPFNPDHLFEQYAHEDHRYFGHAPDAFELVDVSEMLADVPTVSVLPVQERYVDYIDVEDVDSIMVHAPHVLIRFGFRILKGAILQAPEFGVWSYHHGDNRHYRGGPACFWEMVDDSPVTGAILQVLSEKLDAGLVLYRSLSSTANHSLFQNRNQLYWKAAAFVPRVLDDIVQRGWETVREEAERREAGAGIGGMRRTPSSKQVYEYLKLRKSRISQFPKRYLEQWSILLGPDAPAPNRFLTRLEALKLLPNSHGHFLADPMLFEHDGKVWLFFEDYDYTAGRGSISCMEIREGCATEPTLSVLERPYHLSGPFLLRWRNEIFMIPETATSLRVEAYRCVSFPDKWEYCGALLEEVNAVDPKIIEKDGKLWLFVNIAEPGASTWDELCVFHADDLLGPWVPHVRNPVVSDTRYARPAGPLFMRGDRLIRPSQDCSTTYGRALNFFEIVQLNENNYQERLVERLEPESLDADGVHSYSAAGGNVALDIKRFVPSDAPWAYTRMSTYPFPPLLWRAKHFFHPLCMLEKTAVRTAKGMRKLWRMLTFK